MIQSHYPCSETDKILQYLDELGVSPASEIFKRAVWDYSHTPSMKADFYLTHESLMMTKCSFTCDALKMTLFGHEEVNSTPFEGEAFLDALQNNSRQQDTVYAYQIELTSPSTPGHAFFVIQYGRRYRFYQSYVHEYSLKEYLQKGAVDLSHEEFMVFIDGLKKMTASPIWSAETEQFYSRYFRMAKTQNEGKKIAVSLEEVRWKECSLAAVEKLRCDFEKAHFPKMYVIPKGEEKNHFRLDVLIHSMPFASDTPEATTLCYLGLYGNHRNTVSVIELNSAIQAGRSKNMI